MGEDGAGTKQYDNKHNFKEQYVYLSISHDLGWIYLISKILCQLTLTDSSSERLLGRTIY